jgi:hypothetical protein
MQHGCICAAGLATDTNQHVRPIPAASKQRGRLTLNDLRQHGGVFELGAELSLSGFRPVPSPPEVEDAEFRRAAHCRTLSAEELWERMEVVAKESLFDLFGQELEFDGRRATVRLGGGQASLGILRPCEAPLLSITDDDKLRVQVRMSDRPLDLPLTDLRHYSFDLVTPRRELAEATRARLGGGEPALLAVGLTRPYSPGEGQPERHWLQVNNIHFPT